MLMADHSEWGVGRVLLKISAMTGLGDADTYDKHDQNNVNVKMKSGVATFHFRPKLGTDS